MMRFEDVIGTDEKVWFEIGADQADRQAFLEYAKSIGCTWLNGQEIDPVTDSCNGHMSIHRDRKIASVAWFVWFHESMAGVKKYLFADYLQGSLKVPESRLVSETPENCTFII